MVLEKQIFKILCKNLEPPDGTPFEPKKIIWTIFIEDY